MKSWKPAQYPDLSPYLIARDAQRVVDFLKTTFGATDLRRYETPDGKLMHGEVQVGDSVVMIADATADWPGVPTHLHLYVPDVDAVFRKAIAAGGEVVQEPSARAGDPDKRGGVKDPAGNTWWISTQQ